jgi:hypothetical protein
LLPSSRVMLEYGAASSPLPAWTGRPVAAHPPVQALLPLLAVSLSKV